MAEVKKGHRSFLDFLERELSALGLTHWYGSNDSYGTTLDYHDIGKIVTTTERFLFFTWTWKRRIAVAAVIAEPDTPIRNGGKDALRLRVKDEGMLPTLQVLASKFETEFGLTAELIY